MTESKKICPRCFGNGYIRIPNEAVAYQNKLLHNVLCVIVKGKLNYEEPNFDYNGINADKLQ